MSFIGIQKDPGLGFWDMSGNARKDKVSSLQNLRGNVEPYDYTGWMEQSQGPGLGAQRAALDYYNKAALGLTPSLANATMQQGIDANNRGALALAASGRGGDLQGAQRQALSAMAGANQYGAQQGAINRIAEQQQAIQGMAALGQGLSQQGFGYAQLGANVALQNDQNSLGWYQAQRGMNLQQQQNDRDFYGGLAQAGIGAMGSMLGGISAMSDERAKDGIVPMDGGGAGDMVGDVQPIGYRYRPELGLGSDFRPGVSAQQLEGTRLGGLVHTGPDGLKRVDAGGAATAALAASSDQEHRLRALEAALGGGPQGDGMGTQQRQSIGDYEVAMGAAREREAARLSNELAAARSDIEARRLDPRSAFGPTAMRRSDVGPQAVADPFVERGGAMAVSDPFAGDAMPTMSDQPMVVGAASPRRSPGGAGPVTYANPRFARAVADGGGARAMPIEPYRGGASAAPIPTDARSAGEPMTPEQQAIVDAFWDERRRWLGEDEFGRQVVTPYRLGGGAMSSGELRGLGDIEAMDRDYALRQHRGLGGLGQTGRI